MRIGIKCEIHDCTISLAKLLENEGVLENGTAKVLEKDKELRIDNQYYLKNKPVEINFERLASFLLSIKRSLDSLDDGNIEKIRKKISEDSQ